MAGTSSDWVEILEPRSREHMYVNLATGECGWEPPTGAPVRQSDGNQWWELFDTQSSRFYYYNASDRLTVWHRPQGADIVPLSQLQAIKRCSEVQRGGPVGALTAANGAGATNGGGTGTRERLQAQGGGTLGSQGRHTPLPPPEPYPKEGGGGGEEGERESRRSNEGTSERQQGDGSMESDGKDSLRESAQRWQPPPGSKAAMLVKVNSMSRAPSAAAAAAASASQHQHSGPHGKLNGHSACTLNPSSNGKSGATYICAAQAYKTTPAGSKMAADARQAHHLRKASNGSFCLVPSSPGELASSPGSQQRLPPQQCSTPRPVSPQYASTATACLYDDPNTSECPIYDEPPDMAMEVEGAQLMNGTGPRQQQHHHHHHHHPHHSHGHQHQHPHSHSLQKPKLLQPPAPGHTGSRHRRSPSSSDYSPAGLECIKHMVNVDPKQQQGSLLSSPSPGPSSPSPSPIATPDGLLPPHHHHHLHHHGGPRPQAKDGGPGTGVLSVSLEKKQQSWRALEASVLRAMEAHHSRQSSQASQDFGSPPPPPPPAPAGPGGYQDSGYSTGPSPSLRRKSRRRVTGGPGGGRPGSIGSSGELNALNERLMAEMREVVGRSNTMRETRAMAAAAAAGLDSEMAEGCLTGPPHCHSPLGSPRRYGRGPRCSSREDLASSSAATIAIGGSRSLGRGGHHGNLGNLASLDFSGRQKRTYEKVDTLEKSINSQMSLSSPETVGPPSQAGTLDSKVQLESRKKGMVEGRTGSLGPHRPLPGDGSSRCPPGGGVGGGAGGMSGGAVGYQLAYATLRQPPPPADADMADWASKHLNLHTQGLFRRRVSIANMLSWNRGSIKKPMLVTSDRVVRKEACEMFKLVQAYMGDRPSRLDRRHAALLVVTKCWAMQGLRDELYVQLVRQTTGNLSPRSLAAGWELMAVSLAFFAPSPKFCCYLEGYIQRHMEPANDKKREFLIEQQVTQFILDQQDVKKKNSKSRKKRKQNTEDDEQEGLPISTYAKYCYRKLQKVAVTGGKKGLRKPTLEEVDHSRRAIITPSLFGSSLEEVMERQSELFPDRKLPWVQVQLSQYVLALGGAQTEGIFRVPGDIDEVNALKLQVDQWRIPENLSDPNVPASLMKLWYRELEEPLIPMDFYKQCVSHCDDPVAAIGVVHSLPDLNRLVLCYFIHFLQVFAQPSNVSVTKMDVNNLAMVMAPNCLRCQSDDPRIIFENTRKEMSFLRMLIVHLDTTFIEGIV
ncbi:rho GTPase-activating protein 39 isoform X1 [Alosa sapidissima]|uniref:rho GTPase-activating protein 39 isoform X1 n=2 Tax=Alosa sapidissima TaxID=34773 RepID=UPI001C09DB0D|nr:rho GTPase-activating protein 39 isoform X1 [Alosa sapidissima]